MDIVCLLFFKFSLFISEVKSILGLVLVFVIVFVVFVVGLFESNIKVMVEF